MWNKKKKNYVNRIIFKINKIKIKFLRWKILFLYSKTQTLIIIFNMYKNYLEIKLYSNN